MGSSMIMVVRAMVKGATRYAAEQGHAAMDPAAGLSRAGAGGKEKGHATVY